MIMKKKIEYFYLIINYLSKNMSKVHSASSTAHASTQATIYTPQEFLDRYENDLSTPRRCPDAPKKKRRNARANNAINLNPTVLNFNGGSRTARTSG